MKTVAPDGKLKASDIVRADLVPGFQMNLLSTVVRVTDSGWASCTVSTWHPDKGSVDSSLEHRFSSLELDSIREALEALAEGVSEPITWDDIPIQRITFMMNSREVSFETLEFNPNPAEPLPDSSRFDAVWHLIHQPFTSIINQKDA
jgi:hypothetical protein